MKRNLILREGGVAETHLVDPAEVGLGGVMAEGGTPQPHSHLILLEHMGHLTSPHTQLYICNSTIQYIINL